MKAFEKPEVQIINFENADVVVSSGWGDCTSGRSPSCNTWTCEQLEDE